MARIRTIKPEFWSHPVMGRQEDSVKTMALALLNYADDHGYFYADAPLVRAFARPFDDDSKTTLGCLAQLVNIGYIHISEHPVRGKIGLVLAFEDHQRVDKPKDSRIKEFYSSETNPRQIQDASRLERKGKEGKGIGDDAIQNSDEVLERIALSHPANSHLQAHEVSRLQYEELIRCLGTDTPEAIEQGTKAFAERIRNTPEDQRKFMGKPAKDALAFFQAREYRKWIPETKQVRYVETGEIL